MIADSPGVLILLLSALTLLGGVIGYCIALIVVKNSARLAIEASRAAMNQERDSTDSVLERARGSIETSRQLTGQGYDRSASERERTLVEKSRLQEQTIEQLEGQLEALEEQQLQLQNRFTGLTAARNLELAGGLGASISQADTEDLPTLSRRVDPVTGTVAETPSLHMRKARSSTTDASSRKPGTLKQPLPQELDIPTLSESELPELADEMEFDVAGSEQGGTKRGG